MYIECGGEKYIIIIIKHQLINNNVFEGTIRIQTCLEPLQIRIQLPLRGRKVCLVNAWNIPQTQPSRPFT